MKLCPKCGAINKDDATICRYCGRDIAAEGEGAGSYRNARPGIPEGGKSRLRPGWLDAVVGIVFLPFTIPVRLWRGGIDGKLAAVAYAMIILVAILMGILVWSDFGGSATSISSILGIDNPNAAIPTEAVAVAPRPSSTAALVPTHTPRPTETAAVTLAPTPTPVGTLRVVFGGNLRGGPGAYYAVVGTVESGDTLPVYRRTDNGWFQVDGTGDTWIAGILINTPLTYAEVPTAESIPPTPTTTPTPTSTPTPDRTATSQAAG